jgi:outer membrane biosynthesis protein TonB
MPASETPTNPPPTDETDQLTESQSSSATSPTSESSEDSRRPRGYSTSRYVDFETHELLETISQLEDERRWQRIREGIWLSIILHILFFAGLYFVPRYVFHQTQVIDPFDAIKNRKDLKYLDELPDALKELQKAKPKLPPLKANQTQVDQKTLEAIKKAHPAPPAPTPAPQQAQTPTPPAPQPEQPPPTPTTATPQPNPQLALDAPRPAPVPAKPNFSLGQQSAADQLRDAMRKSQQSPGGGTMTGPGLGQHSSAAGGAEILSDTQNVDFGPWLQKVIRETYRTWDPLIPEEVNPPISKRGECEIVFTVLPNGRLQPNAMILTGRSGDVALDRAAWGAIQGANYPQVPHEFTGPNVQLRFRFSYNVR